MSVKDNSQSDTISSTENSQPVRPSGVSHSYDQGIAIGCKSIVAAVLYNHICFWIKHNKIEGHEPINGKTWMWQSIPKMLRYLPEMSHQQIRDALTILVNKKLIIKDNFNKDKFDKKSWYALVDESVLNLENSKNLFEEVPRPDRIGPQTRCTIYSKDKKILDISDDSEPPAVGPSAPSGSEDKPNPKKTAMHIKEKPEKPQKPLGEVKVFYSSNLTEDEVALGEGKLTIPVTKWLQFLKDFGEEALIRVATSLSHAIAENPKRYKKHHLALHNWLMTDKKEISKRPKEKESFRANYPSAGTYKGGKGEILE